MSAAGSWTGEQLARAALTRVRQPGDAALSLAVARHGAQRVWDGLRATYPELDPQVLLDRAAAQDVRLVVPGETEWPPAVEDLARISAGPPIAGGVPLGLWARGPARLAELAGRAVAVVGCRAATGYGEHMAAELSYGLAERGWAVISGAAYGVDGAAHRGALAAGGTTAAVLAGGVDHAYPAGHVRLLGRLATEGAVLSEYPPGCAPTRVRFLARNRLIAALSAAVVLVEADLRSGARNTVAHARALGRLRLVVPGPVTSSASRGCHHELRADVESVLVTSAAEIVEAVGRVGLDLVPLLTPPPRPGDGLSWEQRRLLDAVPRRHPAGVASIGRQLGMDAAAALRLLGVLVAEGLVVAVDNGFRRT